MLPKINRLKKKKDFGKVFKEGKGFKEDFLILKFTQNNSKQIRFGCIVSQKISKRAVVRNKIRRRIIELVGLKIKKLKRGINAILIALPGIEKKDFWEIEEIIDALFNRAKIINV